VGVPSPTPQREPQSRRFHAEAHEKVEVFARQIGLHAAGDRVHERVAAQTIRIGFDPNRFQKLLEIARLPIENIQAINRVTMNSSQSAGSSRFARARLFSPSLGTGRHWRNVRPREWRPIW
jgi:hypothetical protein